MIKFEKIKRLFPEDKYQLGVLSREETCQLGQVKFADAYSVVGAIPLTSETERYWRKIKNSLIILQHSDVALDYDIKPKTQQILVLHFEKDIFLITIDLKAAVIKAGLGCRGYNNLVWNPKFGFDCKIVAWAFCEEIRGYKKPYLSEYFPTCNVNCLRCHLACPSQAFSGGKAGEFKFDMRKCVHIIGSEIIQFKKKNHLMPSVWSGTSGGVKICRACQEQIECQVVTLKNNLSRRKKPREQ